MFNFKKAISPVVATALLLVVAVTAVVGFSSWYDTYSSSMFVSAETRSNSAGSIAVEYVGSNGILYVSNSGTGNVTMDSVEISGIECDLSSQPDLSPGVNSVDISSCLDTTGANNIVIATESGVIEKKFFVEEITSVPSLDCSSLSGDWSLVPGNSYFSTSDFCVMKYEAKNISNVATSQETIIPWQVSFNDAYSNCSNLGSDYHLITNREWMTIARNLELVDSNWDSGTSGTGKMKTGNTGWSEPLVSYNNGGLDYGVGRNSLAELTLSNGETVWDISGNDMEWVDVAEDGNPVNWDICSGNNNDLSSFYGNDGYAECAYSNGYNKTGAIDTRFEIGPLGNYNNDNRIGQMTFLFLTVDIHITRGGTWASTLGPFGDYGGIYNIILDSAQFDTVFRCVYSP